MSTAPFKSCWISEYLSNQGSPNRTDLSTKKSAEHIEPTETLWKSQSISKKNTTCFENQKRYDVRKPRFLKQVSTRYANKETLSLAPPLEYLWIVCTCLSTRFLSLMPRCRRKWWKLMTKGSSQTSVMSFPQALTETGGYFRFIRVRWRSSFEFSTFQSHMELTYMIVIFQFDLGT